jgi:hypothetical protein
MSDELDLKSPKNDNGEEDFTLYGLSLKDEKIPQKITLKLIMDRNLTKSIQDKIISSSNSKEEAAELKAKALLKLTHIRLDREKIIEIDNLTEYLGNITHLYLNVNQVRRIENLDFFNSLKFLVLSNNLIEKIENLDMLVNLKLLDLSFNLIDEIDVEKIPKSVLFLDLRENSCFKTGSWESKNYEEKIIDHLDNLYRLNGEDLFDKNDEKVSVRDESKNSSVDVVVQTDQDQLNQITKNILDRSKLRQKSDIINMGKIRAQRYRTLESLQKSFQGKFSNS